MRSNGYQLGLASVALVSILFVGALWVFIVNTRGESSVSEPAEVIAALSVLFTVVVAAGGAFAGIRTIRRARRTKSLTSSINDGTGSTARGTSRNHANSNEADLQGAELQENEEMLPKHEEAPPNQLHEMEAIRQELALFQEDCSVWAEAYFRASRSVLTWNRRLVAIGIILTVVTTVLLGAIVGVGSGSVQYLAIIGAVVGIATTGIIGSQRFSFANPERAKEYHSTAIGYTNVARQIANILTGSGIAEDELRKKHDDIRTALDGIDSESSELPNYNFLAYRN